MVLRACEPHMLVKRGEAKLYLLLATMRRTTVPGRPRLYPDIESDICRAIALLKANGGEPTTGAIDSCLAILKSLRAASGDGDAMAAIDAMDAEHEAEQRRETLERDAQRQVIAECVATLRRCVRSPCDENEGAIDYALSRLAAMAG